MFRIWRPWIFLLLCLLGLFLVMPSRAQDVVNEPQLLYSIYVPMIAVQEQSVVEKTNFGAPVALQGPTTAYTTSIQTTEMELVSISTDEVNGASVTMQMMEGPQTTWHLADSRGAD